MSKFSAQHYNAIAKDIREELTPSIEIYNFSWSEIEAGINNRARTTAYYAVDALVKLALRFAKRFAADNERFDPLRFLDACSPNEDLYPLSELWEGYNGNN